MFACIHGPGPLLDCARRVSPKVEEVSADTVLLDLRGLDRLLGAPDRAARAIAERSGPKASVAVAANPDAAVHAARGLPGVTVISPGEESRILGELPLELLPASPELQETFALWGLRRFKDLAALPEPGVSQRLGPEGVRLQKLARGQGDRCLFAADPEE